MKAKRKLATLLRSLPVSSRYAGPPKGVMERGDGDPSERVETPPLHAGQTTTVPAFPFLGSKVYRTRMLYSVEEPPAGILRDSQGQSCTWTSPVSYVAIFERARLWGRYGTLISNSDHVPAECLNELYRDPVRELPIFRETRLGRCEQRPGTVAVVAGEKRTYYHWLIDVLPRIEILRASGLSFDIVHAGPLPHAFQQATLEAFDIQAERVVRAADRLHVAFDRVLLPAFASVGIDFSPWALDLLQRTFLPSVPAQHDRMVFLSRRGSGNRPVLNEAELYPMLARYGVEIFFPEDYSVADQARIMSESRVVIGPHGAGLTNLIFCKQGTKVLELFTPQHVCECFWRISMLGSLDHAIHFMERTGERGGKSSTLRPSVVQEFLEGVA